MIVKPRSVWGVRCWRVRGILGLGSHCVWTQSEMTKPKPWRKAWPTAEIASCLWYFLTPTSTLLEIARAHLLESAGTPFFTRVFLFAIYLKVKSHAGVLCDEGARPWARDIMRSGATCLLESGEGSCRSNSRQNVVASVVPKEMNKTSAAFSRAACFRICFRTCFPALSRARFKSMLPSMLARNRA